ncbi:MAG: ATP-binding protein [Candidatus Accumulibacter sp.]|nr:ATP-binding protein [Accumulibacter sp.]
MVLRSSPGAHGTGQRRTKRRAACAYTWIAIEVAESDGFLEFVVRDDGSGFDEQLLNDAGGAAVHVTGEGTGLGLRLARRIAEMHENAGQRGQIRLGNECGAVFRLLLPR